MTTSTSRFHPLNSQLAVRCIYFYHLASDTWTDPRTLSFQGPTKSDPHGPEAEDEPQPDLDCLSLSPKASAIVPHRPAGNATPDGRETRYRLSSHSRNNGGLYCYSVSSLHPSCPCVIERSKFLPLGLPSPRSATVQDHIHRAHANDTFRPLATSGPETSSDPGHLEGAARRATSSASMPKPHSAAGASARS